jgi:hypothetical protein
LPDEKKLAMQLMARSSTTRGGREYDKEENQMNTGNFDYSEVLSDLESQLTDVEMEAAKIEIEAAKIEARRNVIKEMVENTKRFIALNSAGVNAAPIKAPNGASANPIDKPFMGLNITDATIKFLESMGRPQTNKQVIAALLHGGLKTKSNTIDTTIRSSLTRERKKPNTRLTWENGRWGLIDWKMSRSDEREAHASPALFENRAHA